MLHPEDAGNQTVADRILIWAGAEPMPHILGALQKWGWQCRPWQTNQARPDLVIVPADAIWQAGLSTPFMAIGCRDADQRLAWLRRGAGDAVCRDAGPEELHWRAQRLLTGGALLYHGNLLIDPVQRSIRRGRAPAIALKPREFALLHALVQAKGNSLSRRDLLRHVWRLDFDPGTNSVAVHIHRLRARLAEGGLAGLITTTRDGRYGLLDPAKMLECDGLCSIDRPQSAMDEEDCQHDRSPPRDHRFSGQRHCRCAVEPRRQDERAGSGDVQRHRGCD